MKIKPHVPLHRIGDVLMFNLPGDTEYLFIITHMDDEKYYYELLDANTKTFITNDNHYIRNIDCNLNITSRRMIFEREMKEIINGTD